MKRGIVRCVAFCLSVLLLLGGAPTFAIAPELSGSPVLSTGQALNVSSPRNAAEAIAAALVNDPEIPALQARENNMLGRLARLRIDPMEYPNAETSELISDIYQLWGQHTQRCHQIAYDVLSSIMAIDTEMNKQTELIAMLVELSVWLGFAQADFRMSRIESSLLDALREKNDKAQRDLAAVELHLSTHSARFRELTGFSMPEDFDFKSAWLVTDVNRVILQPTALPAPVTLFSEVEGVAVLGGSVLPTESLANRARIELMDLHEAVGRYAAADKSMEAFEALHRRGEISRYQFFDAIYDRMAARMVVFERKQIYATAMLELDRNLDGLISSRYRIEPVLWFFESAWIYEGRKNISYDWAEEYAGWWQAVRASGTGGRISLEIREPWISDAQISRVAIYYNGELLVEGRGIEALIFVPPVFTGNSLMEIALINENGAEVSRVYIDGLANAGRFFEYIPPPVPDVDEPQGTEEPGQETDDADILPHYADFRHMGPINEAEEESYG